MEKRTAYVANYLDEGTWDLVQRGSVESWADAAFPYMHPLVLVSDQPTKEWLDQVKDDAATEYLACFQGGDDDQVPELTWMPLDPRSDNTAKSWSQEHNARDAEHHLHIVVVVRRVEVAIA